MIRDIIKLTSTNNKNDRLEYYGQEDHVRIYSRNGYINKLKNTGFVLEIYRCSEFFEENKNFGLIEDEEVFFVKKFSN